VFLPALLARKSRGGQAIDSVGRFNTAPKGALKVNVTIGFSYFVLAETLPAFLDRDPQIELSLDLTSHPIDPVAGGIDVAIPNWKSAGFASRHRRIRHNSEVPVRITILS
jgi:DNA-binding transcriptional LysR family regulator